MRPLLLLFVVLGLVGCHGNKGMKLDDPHRKRIHLNLEGGIKPASRVVAPYESRSPKFDVHYKVWPEKDKLSKIELYYNVNGSPVWYKYGEDKDLTSPIEFVAKSGGRFGFKVVATSLEGISESLPDANTEPDIVCLMDSVPPVVKLLNFKRSNIKKVWIQKGREVIWEAHDDNMMAKPIKLEFTLNGKDWHLLENALENDGRYVWKSWRHGSSDQARLRITAIDELGNTGTDVSSPFEYSSGVPIRTFTKKIKLPSGNIIHETVTY